MKRAITAGAIFLAFACGRDDRLDLYVVFPDEAASTRTKSISFDLVSDPDGTPPVCPTPVGTAVVKRNVDWPPASTEPVAKEALPEGTLAVAAAASDVDGVFLRGCTEAKSRRGRDLEVVVVLASPRSP